MATRPLTQTEIARLITQSCSAEQWETVFIAEGCDLSRLQGARFAGTVRVGFNGGSIPYHGVNLPCGIYNSALTDCDIADGVRIAGVRTGMARYSVEEGAHIEDVGFVASEPGSSFGNGTEVDVVNEGGGRGTTIFNRLTSQVAYLQAMFRHNAVFGDKLRATILAEIAASTPPQGVIRRNARVVGCGRILNVVVGPFARIEGASLLENGTVNSCEEQPTIVGAGVHARDFILAEGAKVESGATLDKVYVGQAAKMGKQYSAENSVFFANCEAFHGEGVSLFAGPYTVTHHKSTLMIAGLFSFYNAGSGTNQSNHMYKLGPVHQGVFERGCKTGSFSYVLMESHLAPFTVVIGKHLANIRIPNLPFSYIGEKGGESSIFPGMTLFSVGTVRDGEKWPKRDGRKMPDRHDLIVFDVFSPYTVEKMRRGRDELLALNETTPKDRASVLVGGLQISRPLLRKGAKYYQSAVIRYLYERILSRLAAALEEGQTWEKACASLRTARLLIRSTDWTDISGLLAPVERVREIEKNVTEGIITTYDALLSALRSLYDSYRDYEWQYVVDAFERETGAAVEHLTQEAAAAMVDEWHKAAASLQSSILEDSRKEFGPTARIGFGLDLGEEEAERDFTAVRGTMETNAVVTKMAAEAEQIAARAATLRNRLTAGATPP